MACSTAAFAGGNNNISAKTRSPEAQQAYHACMVKAKKAYGSEDIPKNALHAMAVTCDEQAGH
ncbi:hypothetical protein KHC27_05015 [Ancylobacter lacus]|nr:hypothetical protein [Ancylobacter lacus]